MEVYVRKEQTEMASLLFTLLVLVILMAIRISQPSSWHKTYIGRDSSR